MKEPVQLLRDEFIRRREKNPSFSLRSYAKFLKISPSRLSQVLSRRRTLTLGQIDKIADALMLSPDAKANAQKLVHSSALKNQGSMTLGPKKTRNYPQIEMETFRFVSDWYHSAILCLLQAAECKSDPSWLAKRLGISVIEARGAIERLTSLGLVKIVKGRLVTTSENLATTTDIPSSALKKYHKKMIAKAGEAIDEQSVNDRDITSMSMTIDKDKLETAKTMIRQFRRQLCDFLESGQQEEVYALNIQLFQLTKEVRET